MPLPPSDMSKRLFSACFLACSFALTACSAMPGPTAFYGFGFSVKADTPGIVVLDYRYTRGDRVVKGLPAERRNDPSFQGTYETSITGQLLIGDKLYVKWKDKSTGVIREADIDLSGRLPSSLQDKKIHFVIGNETVNVYVASIKGVITTGCLQIQKERALSPNNPDLIARSLYCGKQLDKIYPEMKNLNNYKHD